MSAAEVHQLADAPITSHAFNADRSQVAISPNSEEVQIYKKSGNTWTQTTVLGEHDKIVTSIDWAPKTNRIVTCSQDRNAYVWTLESDGSWKPKLVVLRINRAATFVRWSPKEDKFAVASGARTISVCHFEADNDWWVSKHIKKPIRSTVFSVDWHPGNILIAAGSADMKARVFSAYIKDVDDKCPPNVWGDKFPFNQVCGEYGTPGGGWVHAVAFSPSGDALAWAAHDSSVNIAYPGQGHAVVTVRTSLLPFRTLLFATEKSIIAAGHDCAPMLFTDSGNGSWSFVDKMDKAAGKSAAGGNSAMNKFKQMDSRAQSSDSAETQLDTTHQNTVSNITVHTGKPGSVQKFATSAVDGKLIIWDVKSIETAFANLKLK